MTDHARSVNDLTGPPSPRPQDDTLSTWEVAIPIVIDLGE